jgi:glucokinase
VGARDHHNGVRIRQPGGRQLSSMPSASDPRDVLCIDIGGTSTKIALVTARGDVEGLESIPTRPPVEDYIRLLIDRVGAFFQQQASRNINRLGVAVAGFLDAGRTHLAYNSNLSWLENFPLRSRLAEAFPQLSIELEIDSNAATMAEYRFGSGQGSRRFLCVTSGTGLGVGMTVDGEPLRFAYGCMGDIGHVIVLRDGPLCTCGGRGCAEALVSAPAVAERYRVLTGAAEELSLRDVIEAAQSNKKDAHELLAETGVWLGLAIASMANILFPDHIAVAGGLSAAGDFVLGPAERAFREAAGVFTRSQTTFEKAKLGSMATLIGSAWPFWREEVNQ